MPSYAGGPAADSANGEAAEAVRRRCVAGCSGVGAQGAGPPSSVKGRHALSCADRRQFKAKIVSALRRLQKKTVRAFFADPDLGYITA